MAEIANIKQVEIAAHPIPEWLNRFSRVNRCAGAKGRLLMNCQEPCLGQANPFFKEGEALTTIIEDASTIDVTISAAAGGTGVRWGSGVVEKKLGSTTRSPRAKVKREAEVIKALKPCDHLPGQIVRTLKGGLVILGHVAALAGVTRCFAGEARPVRHRRCSRRSRCNARPL